METGTATLEGAVSKPRFFRRKGEEHENIICFLNGVNMRRDITDSPQLYARIGGALYLIIIAIGASGELFIRNRLVVRGDPGATAGKIRESEHLWRAGIAGEIVLLICAVMLTLILYRLLAPVGRDLALMVVFFNLVSIAVEAAASLSLVKTLFPLADASYLAALEPQQLHALAYFSIRAHGYGFGSALIFFGAACLFLGTLIYRSGYLPRPIGVLIQIAGLCYLINSFALILSPPLAGLLFPAILLPPFVAETSLCLWLLIRGVNPEMFRLRLDQIRTE